MHDTLALAAAFARALAPGCAPREPHALAPAVVDAWRRAREAHPELVLDGAAFLAFAGERIRAGDPRVELAHRHVADLAIAFGCAREHPVALAALEREIMPAVARGLARFSEPRELLQILRERMLVGLDRHGIAGYDGRAPLALWLRVCATRIGLREAERTRRLVELDDKRLDELAPGVPDPELAYLKRLYGAQFRAAFVEAVASLSPRERTLLRLSVIDGLGIDQLGAIYHVHRATAARRLEQARAALVTATRDRMRAALGVGESELESILRMITSLADLTLRQVLARGRGHARKSV